MKVKTPFDLMLKELEWTIIRPEFHRDMVKATIVVTLDEMVRYTAGLLSAFMRFQNETNKR